MVSNVEEVYKAASPIYNMGKMQLYKLVLWFPHIRVREYFILKLYVVDVSLLLIFWHL